MSVRFVLFEPKPGVETLEFDFFTELLETCGYEVVMGPHLITEALAELKYQSQRRTFVEWLQNEEITHLWLSSGANQEESAGLVDHLVHELLNGKMLVHQGGPLRGLYFQGSPEACQKIDEKYQGLVKTFQGKETVQEALNKLGLLDVYLSANSRTTSEYDVQRLVFG